MEKRPLSNTFKLLAVLVAAGTVNQKACGAAEMTTGKNEMSAASFKNEFCNYYEELCKNYPLGRTDPLSLDEEKAKKAAKDSERIQSLFEIKLKSLSELAQKENKFAEMIISLGEFLPVGEGSSLLEKDMKAVYLCKEIPTSAILNKLSACRDNLAELKLHAGFVERGKQNFAEADLERVDFSKITGNDLIQGANASCANIYAYLYAIAHTEAFKIRLERNVKRHPKDSGYLLDLARGKKFMTDTELKAADSSINPSGNNLIKALSLYMRCENLKIVPNTGDHYFLVWDEKELLLDLPWISVKGTSPQLFLDGSVTINDEKYSSSIFILKVAGGENGSGGTAVSVFFDSKLKKWMSFSPVGFRFSANGEEIHSARVDTNRFLESSLLTDSQNAGSKSWTKDSQGISYVGEDGMSVRIHALIQGWFLHMPEQTEQKKTKSSIAVTEVQAAS